MGMVIVFAVSMVFFTLTFSWIKEIIRLTWVIIMYGNEYMILGVVFVGMGAWFFLVL